MPRLNGKNILVTGASQGLGRQLALTFAHEGAIGLSLIARHLGPLQKVRDEVGEISKRTNVLAVEADVGKISDIERLVATTLDAFGGRLDVVVNNASTIGSAPMPFLLDYPLEDFQNVMNTNLIGPFLIIKNILPAMVENGGSIINVTSDAGATGYPGWGAYGISKFGLEGLSQTWAAELEETGVRVNWVDPGNMTDMCA
ncbi:MAG: dehydrogenase [Verrucomicrobia bacterium]|nr:MAG: dehydrogenase [Verrucomicrobiota bacterium]